MKSIKNIVRLLYREWISNKRRNKVLSYSEVPMDPSKWDIDCFGPNYKACYEQANKEWVEYANSLRMYVLVRRDILPLVHSGVQAAHAVAEYLHTFKDEETTNKWVSKDKTLLFLTASADQIGCMKRKFEKDGKKYQSFCEPDMSDIETAVAFEPLTMEEGKKYFKDFSLLS
jgi:hypothetical protein